MLTTFSVKDGGTIAVLLGLILLFVGVKGDCFGDGQWYGVVGANSGLISLGYGGFIDCTGTPWTVFFKPEVQFNHAWLLYPSSSSTHTGFKLSYKRCELLPPYSLWGDNPNTGVFQFRSFDEPGILGIAACAHGNTACTDDLCGCQFIDVTVMDCEGALE